MQRFFLFFSVVIALVSVTVFTIGADAARFCSLPYGVGASHDTVSKNSEINCYEEDSFFTTSRTLPLGATMTFVNFTDEPLRVASGPHPAHDDLPDFDSGNIGKYEWYTYTFDKRGTWSFHNHYRPDIGGEVTIVGKIYDTSKEKPPQVNVVLPAAAKKDTLPKNFEKLKVKKNIKQLKDFAKKELAMRLNALRSELDKKRWWKEVGKNSDSNIAQAVFQELQTMYHALNGYSSFFSKEKNGKVLGDRLKKMIDERVLSIAVPRAQLLLEIDTFLEQSEQLEDYLLQAERPVEWLENGSEKDAIEEQLKDVQEELGDMQENMEQTRDALVALSVSSPSVDTVLKNARASFEHVQKNVRAVERTIGDATQKIYKLSDKQSDGKFLKEITSGEACKGSSKGNSGTLHVICYQDEDFKTWNYIEVGRKVIFYNNSSEPMWIASDPHPAHSNLVGFDQRKAVPKGGTYEYTFTKLGKYYFHNHMNPQRTGKIKISSKNTIEFEAEDIQMNQLPGGWPTF